MHRARVCNRAQLLASSLARLTDTAYRQPVSTLAVLVAIALALAVGFAVGYRQRKAVSSPAATPRDPDPPPMLPAMPSEPAAIVAPEAPVPLPADSVDRGTAERARIIRSLESETAMLRQEKVSREAAVVRLSDLAADRRRLYVELANARGDAARYRQLVIDLENNAPPPFFGSGAPDDLKLIVGIGPMLERMLQQLGITTYRQIARWSERDIDDFDAKLPEFPGRIRRDAWVTQARALHASKYGAPPSARDR